MQNKTLLNKGIWRYNEENESLRRRVIQEKNGGNPSKLLPRVNESNRVSKVWRNITLPFSPTKDYYNFLFASMGVVVGKGHNVLFLCDEWLKGVILESAFPQIFALATNKLGIVSEFGNWVNDN